MPNYAHTVAAKISFQTKTKFACLRATNHTATARLTHRKEALYSAGCFCVPFTKVPINGCTLDAAPNAAEHTAGMEHLRHPTVTAMLLFTCFNLILNNRPKAITAFATLPLISVLLLSHNITDEGSLTFIEYRIVPTVLVFVGEKNNNRKVFERVPLRFYQTFFL